jgi:hypothetical protein
MPEQLRKTVAFIGVNTGAATANPGALRARVFVSFPDERLSAKPGLCLPGHESARCPAGTPFETQKVFARMNLKNPAQGMESVVKRQLGGKSHNRS